MFFSQFNENTFFFIVIFFLNWENNSVIYTIMAQMFYKIFVAVNVVGLSLQQLELIFYISIWNAQTEFSAALCNNLFVNI